MIKEAIAKIIKVENLSEAEAHEVMSEIMSGVASEAQIASYITALRMKGETADEITGSAKAMREFAAPINVKPKICPYSGGVNIGREIILDTCGTGGDGTNTFNVSTAAALVAAACGLSVAKHGNRSVSSACGSADVLEALGVNLDITTKKVEECISEAGLGFLFAPVFHGAMKHAIGPRRQIGIRTIFNVLGPLTNPANANAQLLGVYSDKLVSLMAEVLKNLAMVRAWVVHGKDGADEISITGPTIVAELDNGKIDYFEVTPEEFGLRRGSLADIKGGDAKTNAAIILKVLDGAKGPMRDIVLLNAAAGLYLGSKAASARDGIALAAEAIDSGRAKMKLDKLVECTRNT